MRAAGFTDIVGADDECHVGGLEFLVDVIELEDEIVGHARFGEQNIHLTRHSTGDGMDREFHQNVRRLQELYKFIELLLRLRRGEPIARNDDDAFGVAHENARVSRRGRLQAAFDVTGFVLGRFAKICE